MNESVLCIREYLLIDVYVINEYVEDLLQARYSDFGLDIFFSA